MSFYTFLPKLLNMSLTASVAIVLVILLRLLLKKAPKVISYALWGIVLFRLLCPVSIGSSLSLYNLFDAPTEEAGAMTSVMEYVPENIVHTEYPSVVLPVPGVSEAINEALPQGEEQMRADPLEGPVFIATYVWGAGVLVMVIYGLATYIRLRRKLLIAVKMRDNIYLADGITSPFVLGLFRPKIYLPSTMEEKEQSYILLHEQHHIRRGDHIVKALAFAALCIHWFNPLVWVAFILSGKDMEMSCDEAVVKKMGDGILADYTASLLSLATGKHIIAGMPLAFGEGNTKGRIHNLANWKKPAFWVVLLAVVACVVLAVCLLTNPNSDNRIESLKYSSTSFINDTEQSEVMTGYNRESRAMSVTVYFERTEGPSTIELVYGYKKNGIGTEWAYDGPVSLALGESTTFTVPADNHFSFEAISLAGENGNVTLVFMENDAEAGSEGLSNRLANPTELIPGTTYVSWQCLYMNPLSSYAAMGGDSGCKYIINENSFVILNRSNGQIVSINNSPAVEHPSVDSSESTPVRYEADVDKWDWQKFPYTDEEWAALYVPGGFGGMENISEVYDEILYQPIEKNRFLLRVDGDLWLVELRNNDRMGTYLWSIYSLVPESAMGVAQWEYAPMLSSRSPVFRFEFDMEYTEISASCVDGSLVDWEASDKSTGHDMAYEKGEALCWSPQDEDETRVSRASIFFTVLNGDEMVYAGTLYIEGTGGNSDGRPIYTASLVGTSLHLEPNPEREGGIITAIDYPDVHAAEEVFEANFGGNTSFGQKMILTEEEPYWRITIHNTGEGSVQMELMGEVYRVEANTTETFFATEPWSEGTYDVSFSCVGLVPMQGSAVCERSSVPLSGSASLLDMTLEHDLTTSDLEASVDEIDRYVFYTNSEQIAVEVDSNETFNGKIILVDISQNNAEILEAKVSSNDDNCLFTGLTSARRYKLSCEGLDGCTLTVSGDG